MADGHRHQGFGSMAIEFIINEHDYEISDPAQYSSSQSTGDVDTTGAKERRRYEMGQSLSTEWVPTAQHDLKHLKIMHQPQSDRVTMVRWHTLQKPNPRPNRRARSSTREFRPKYAIEEAYFIWYHRTDLNEPWEQVLQEHRAAFPSKRGKGGLQCRFYRLLDEHKVEKVRAQTGSPEDSLDRSRGVVGRYGVVQRTGKRFKWMKAEHQDVPPLPQFRAEQIHE